MTKWTEHTDEEKKEFFKKCDEAGDIVNETIKQLKELRTFKKNIKKEIEEEKKWILQVIRIANKRNRLIEGAYIIDIEKPLENSIKELNAMNKKEDYTDDNQQ